MTKHDIYDLGDNVYLGNQFTYCWRCKEKLQQENPSLFSEEAIKKLRGKFDGKKIYRLETLNICENCIDEIQKLIKEK